MLCDICGIEFLSDSIWSYVNHIETHIIDKMSKSFVCVLCSKAFDAKNAFYNHLKKQHFNNLNSICNLNIDQSFHQDEYEISNALMNENIANEDVNRNDIFGTAKTISTKEIIERKFIKLILRFLNNDTVTRKHCFEIFNSIFDEFKSVFQLLFSELNSGDMTFNLMQIENYFVNETIKFSEHRFFKQLEQYGTLIPFHKELLHVNATLKTSNAGTIILDEEYFLYTFDIIKFLTILFENDQFLVPFFIFYDYIMNNENSNEINNILNSAFWHDKMSKVPFDPTTIFLPISIFYDDCETMNPLGAHNGAYAIGDCFLKILCLPPQFNSKLDFILPLQINYSSDRKKFGNFAIFNKIINRLNYLYDTGIPINFKSYKTVKFLVCYLQGDNKGLSELMHFVGNFSTANFFCRMCKSPKDIIKSLSVENLASLRTLENYKSDLLISKESLTGIKGSTPFNNIKNFHIIDNATCDPMHDLHEGVSHYLLSNILLNFVDNKYFSIDQLNDRLKSFDFGPSHSNLPDILNQDMLDKKRFRFTAAEMETFSLNFNLLVGPFVFNRSQNEHWELYLVYREILILCSIYSVFKNTFKSLQLLVETFNTLYVKLFGETLKYKFHLLTHYGSLMKKYGALAPFSNMRSESKHTVFTRTINASQCKKNILKTCSVKVQIKFAHFLMNFDFGKDIEVGFETLFDKKSVDFLRFPSHLEQIKEISFLSIFGKKFKKNVVFSLNKSIIFNEFGEVKKILKIDDEYFILYNKLFTNNFDQFLDVFQVTTEPLELNIINIQEIDFKHQNFKLSYIYKTANDKKYVNYLHVK